MPVKLGMRRRVSVRLPITELCSGEIAGSWEPECAGEGTREPPVRYAQKRVPFSREHTTGGIFSLTPINYHQFRKSITVMIAFFRGVSTLPRPSLRRNAIDLGPHRAASKQRRGANSTIARRSRKGAQANTIPDRAGNRCCPGLAAPLHIQLLLRPASRTAILPNSYEKV